MYIKELVTELKFSRSQGEIDVHGISIGIDKINKGDLFFDLKGDKNINTIFERGAAFVIRLGGTSRSEGEKIWSCANPREIYALASKRYFKNCCDKMKLIGITGTNGKSSVAKLVYDIFSWSGRKVGMIGTMGCRYDNTEIETGFTTPDPFILHRLFYQMHKCGIEYVVMEVSAHAIELKKLSGIKFDIFALTNISQDHLDFFENMEKYASTKLSMFDKKYIKQGIVCVDDDRARGLVENVNVPLISYGVENPSDIFAIDIEESFDGTKFICNCLDEISIIQTNLVGGYNVLNTLCAIGICNICGMDIVDITCALRYAEAEIGRFNIIKYDGINIVIDYAHTPDGLEKVLQTAKSICEGRLVVLFGCGGNRDASKRKIMGSVAEKYADEIFLTNDNPRLENPMEIVSQIAEGIKDKNYHIELDRKLAIYQAISFCERGDCLIIAGKGGEKYQDIGGKKIQYSDFDEVYKFFRNNITLVNKGS